MGKKAFKTAGSRPQSPPNTPKNFFDKSQKILDNYPMLQCTIRMFVSIWKVKNSNSPSTSTENYIFKFPGSSPSDGLLSQMNAGETDIEFPSPILFQPHIRRPSKSQKYAVFKDFRPKELKKDFNNRV
jgi:hypothetical protein